MIAFLPIARTTFDIPFAEAKTDDARRTLRALIGDGITMLDPGALITDMDGARAAASLLSEQPLDLVIVFQATFADSTLITAITDATDAPILLWAVCEPQVGGRLRLNSFCGINLAAYALKRRGIRYAHLYADPDDAGAAATLQELFAAGRAVRLLRGARVGVVGTRPDGFEPCDYDPAWLEGALGVKVYPYDLQTMFDRADALKANDSARLDARYTAVAGDLPNLAEMNNDQVRGTLSFYEAMGDTIHADQLKGVAVRCWPETFLKRDCAICAASSMLTDRGIPASCEADVNGAVSQLILQSLSESPAFSADLVAADAQTNTGVFWHCGLAPLSFCDPEAVPRAALHSNRQRPLLMEFPLKPGRVTLARLTHAGDSGAHRLVIGSGEMIRAPMQFTGTSGVCRFDTPVSTVLDTILDKGLDHHFTLTYGDHSAALRRFAAFAGLEAIPL